MPGSDWDNEARSILRYGVALMLIGVLFWAAVIAGAVALIVHFA